MEESIVIYSNRFSVYQHKVGTYNDYSTVYSLRLILYYGGQRTMINMLRKYETACQLSPAVSCGYSSTHWMHDLHNFPVL